MHIDDSVHTMTRRPRFHWIILIFRAFLEWLKIGSDGVPKREQEPKWGIGCANLGTSDQIKNNSLFENLLSDPVQTYRTCT